MPGRMERIQPVAFRLRGLEADDRDGTATHKTRERVIIRRIETGTDLYNANLERDPEQVQQTEVDRHPFFLSVRPFPSSVPAAGL